MSAWLVLAAVFVCLWLFWAALGTLFDWITDYQHPHTRVAADAEDSSPHKEKERFVSQQESPLS